MACDTNVSVGDAYFRVPTKIYRIGDELIGGAGNSSAIAKFLRWYPRRFRTRPPELAKKEDLAVLVLSEAGLFYYSEEFVADQICDPYFAIGTGDSVALTAMDCGLDPEGAVKAACRRDPDNTKAPVIVEWLHEDRRR